MLQMLLVDNLMHADLHPGNILVHIDERNRFDHVRGEAPEGRRSHVRGETLEWKREGRDALVETLTCEERHRSGDAEM